MKSDIKEKKTVKPLTSVHVIHYACSNCAEEEEDAKLCNDCKAPMRVIQVVELYGEEANEYLDNLNKKNGVKKEKPSVGVEYDDSVIGVSDEEETEGDVVDDVELGDIFPDSDENKEASYVGEVSSDFEAALDVLDQEDDDEDIEDLPEL